MPQSQRSNGTYCISLTDNGSYGFPHSGGALLLPNNGQYPGYFTVVAAIKSGMSQPSWMHAISRSIVPANQSADPDCHQNIFLGHDGLRSPVTHSRHLRLADNRLPRVPVVS